MIHRRAGARAGARAPGRGVGGKFAAALAARNGQELKESQIFITNIQIFQYIDAMAKYSKLIPRPLMSERRLPLHLGILREWIKMIKP